MPRLAPTDTDRFFPRADVGFNDMEIPSFDDFLAARGRYLERRRHAVGTAPSVLRPR